MKLTMHREDGKCDVGFCSKDMSFTFYDRTEYSIKWGCEDLDDLIAFLNLIRTYTPLEKEQPNASKS